MMKREAINPVVVEAIRGTIVENYYRGAFAVIGAKEHLVASSGNIKDLVFIISIITLRSNK